MTAEPTFEEAQAELERIVERLELYKRCAAQLTDTQGKIEELAKRLDAGDA
jgi:exonuclease VII small subunit